MRNVIVTGGSRGIGLRHRAPACASGFQVIADRPQARPRRLDGRRSRPTAGPGAIAFVPLDLGEIDAIPALVARASGKRLRPDLRPRQQCGLGTEGLLATMQNPHIEALIRLNTLSPIMLTKYVVRAMMAEGGGRIVNISSIVGSTGLQRACRSTRATKASMVGFTRSLAREVGTLDITVNAVAPGFIDTEMTRGLGEQARARSRAAARCAACPRSRTSPARSTS